MAFQPSMMTKLNTHIVVTPVPFIGGFDYVMAPPNARHELINVIDVEACCASYHGLCLQDAQEVSKMLASADAWGPLDGLDDTAWIKAAATSGGSKSKLTRTPTARPKIRQRRVKCAEDIARRQAHRRALQKGYERVYRERKRAKRDHIRDEWLSLEAELKTKLVSAQTKAVVSSVAPSTASSSKLSPVAFELAELRRETQALTIEHLVLQCALSSEEQLTESREYFSQAMLRERLNQIASVSWVFQREFSW